MGFSVKDLLGGLLNKQEPREDYFLDDGYDDDEDYEEEPARGGLFSSRNQESSSGQKSGGLFGSRAKVVPIQQPTMQVSMKRPKDIDDSENICDDLLDGMAVVINLEGVSQDQAQRIIDFTYGAVYSIDGELKMISKYIFIASPHSVALSGDFVSDFNMKGGKSGYQDSRSQSRTTARAASGFGFNG